jgi:seryl-tRNA synthetase
MTHNLNEIKQNWKDFVRLTKSRRFNEFDLDLVIKTDEDRKKLILQTQDLQNKRNTLAKQIGLSKNDKTKYNELMEESNSIKLELTTLENELDKKQKELDFFLDRIPNLIDSSVPLGEDETKNAEIKKWGSLPNFDFEIKDHSSLGLDLKMMDFETAAKNSGSRFVYLYKDLAKLERALINFALNELSKENFIEVSPPLLVNANAYYGTGQLPKFEGDFFKTTDDRFLISTSEISLANIHSDSIVDEASLPLRYTAVTPCFRSEAGSSGKDTKGMIRLHQFYKVEMVVACTPENSESEHQKMLAITEGLLQKLNLAYRVVNLCSGDIGFSASKTYDIECWMSGQNKYREVASISNTKDFQARRMMARFKKSEIVGKGGNEYLHLLNGTAIACGRILCAIMENNQNKDGSINIPKCLQSYLGGLEVIKK